MVDAGTHLQDTFEVIGKLEATLAGEAWYANSSATRLCVMLENPVSQNGLCHREIYSVNARRLGLHAAMVHYCM